MGTLTIYDDGDGTRPLLTSSDNGRIAEELARAGIRFEQWTGLRELPADAGDADVIAAYQPEIDRLVAGEGYRSYDVVRMLPDNEKREEMRGKFLDEHTHAEDEVRFFVEGSGMFYLHVGGKVYMVLCEAGDFISVPAGTRHWFDMGPRPRFTALRLFMSPDGWVASFTGAGCSRDFPRYEAAAA
ncbi:MAG: cupin domain-containing protein [Alphaproteobacteria bacterium]|nr:cupin domain-containing protein [Alphaproteobacteria bacterium]